MPTHTLDGLTRITTERKARTQSLVLFERHLPQGELILPIGESGTAVEDLGRSPSKRWLVTQRHSGQGEWGYDVIDLKTFERAGGVLERRGYMLDLPSFDGAESRLVGGYGSAWLGGWWAHSDDELDEPARGGETPIGWLFDHSLDNHQVRWHQLMVDVPKGWLPNDACARLGPRDIRPMGSGFALTMPGGHKFEHPTPVPDLVALPPPNRC